MTYPLFRLPQDAPTRQEVEVVVAREKHYVRINVEDWEKINVWNGATGRTINHIPWEGDKHISVKITEEELESLKDERGEIRFEKVLCWTLPTFGDGVNNTLFE